MFVQRFCCLGLTVILTFAILWWPILSYPPTHDESITLLERLSQVLQRIFPFHRGLFEGKVSNIWCALSTKPVKIRQRVSQDLQPLLALGLTMVMILPASIKLFALGRWKREAKDFDLRFILWGATSTALAFFLASFQVHEKSILMAVAPLSLLALENDFKLINLFCLTATWTLWPLLRVDRLETAYVCLVITYLLLLWIYPGSTQKSILDCNLWTKICLHLWIAVLVGLHVLELTVTVPSSLPDLFPVLWSIAGCAMICFSWAITCWYLFIGPEGNKAKRS
jgi:alpha-1,3-glucosyltransferase